MIKIEFERTHNGFDFKDAIVLTQEEFDRLTEQQIEDIKEERFQNWINAITPQQEEQV